MAEFVRQKIGFQENDWGWSGFLPTFWKAAAFFDRLRLASRHETSKILFDVVAGIFCWRGKTWREIRQTGGPPSPPPGSSNPRTPLQTNPPFPLLLRHYFQLTRFRSYSPLPLLPSIPLRDCVVLFPTSADRPLPSLHASASDPSSAIGKAGRPPNSPPLFPAIRTGSLRSVALPLPRVLFVAQVKEGEGGRHSGLSHRQRLQPRLQATATNFPRSPPSLWDGGGATNRQ